MIALRPFRSDEAPLLYALEQRIWPPHIQATSEQLCARVEAFPSGVQGVWVNESLVGFGSSQIVHYSPALSPEQLAILLPRRGIISRNHDPTGNCLHLMSGGILPEFRRRGLWRLLVQSRISLAKMLNLEWVIVDSRMHSYVNRPARYAACSPIAYATTLEAGVPVDPYLAFFSALGFRFIASVASSYTDPESGDIWPFLACCLETGRTQ